MSANRPLDEELRRRARRLLDGDRRTDDLDRLYLGLRGRARGFDAVREIGDFVAHRDERSKGFISQVARDVFTSVDVWSMDLRGLKASWTDIGRAAEANLRLASNALVKDGCGCGKSVAKQRVDSALEKINGGERITEAEARALTFLGNRFIWRPAFWADQLVDEFGRLLVRCGLIGAAERAIFDAAQTTLSLHALAAMHNSSIDLGGGKFGRLYAGFGNTDRWL